MKTTFSRTFSTVCLVLLVVLLAVGVSFRLLVKDYLTEEAVASLESDAEVIAQVIQACYSDPDMNSTDFHLALTVAASVSGADAVICDAEGTLLMCANEPLGCEHTGMVLSSTEYLERVFTEGTVVDTGIVEGLYTDVRYVISVPVTDPDTGARMGIVMVSAPISEALIILNNVTNMFTLVSVLAIVVALVFMTVSIRRQSYPLRDMARTATAFGHGDLNARVHTDGRNAEEVEALALAFNNMASSLQKSEDRRQEFVANVSHELKTPMTTISGYVDGILDGTIPPEKTRQYLTLVSEETKRLSRLVRSMLDISRLQDRGGIQEEQKVRFDATELAGQVLISFEQKINEKKLDVQVDMPEHPVYTRADQDAITQVVYNLVDNAVKFSPEGGTLALTLREGGSKIYVSVSNDGETIPPDQLELVFDRFHKIDKSRSKNRDSWGLGLYIVKTIVDSHGENISVTSRDDRTTFTFTLPLVN
ncbi:MAG: HAMP domain-containing histidine kinase [Firmicutes bacterium]|nr:HAMP domain-containing histidine kinase [Bacillota bacterium]